MKFKAGEIFPSGSKTLTELANIEDLDKEGQELFNLACPSLPQPTNQIVS
jgi:hypothetical protein